MNELPNEALIYIHKDIIFSAVGAIVMGAILLYTIAYQYIKRDQPITIALQTALFLYIGGYAVYASSRQASYVFQWTRICYTGLSVIPLIFYLLASKIVNHRRSAYIIWSLGIYTAFWLGIIWTNDRLLITRTLHPAAVTDPQTMIKGPLLLAFLSSNFLIISITFSMLLIRDLAENPHIWREQWPFIIAFTVWILNNLYDSLGITGLIQAPAQPWVGPMALAVMTGVFFGQHTQAQTESLKRRIKELDSLQVVSRALSASLNLDSIMTAIYSQVSRLMPTHIFYIGLHNPETNEISFPLVVEEQRRIDWPTRRWGKGLTEHVLTSRKHLWISEDFVGNLKKLEIQLIGQPVASWMGVPILSDNRPLGIIVVQSLTDPELYDQSHLEILTTIASQAGLVIQNARLYTQTDEALTRRVRELNSILRTTQDGIMLLDSHWRIVAVNRALTEFLGLLQSDWVEQYLIDIVMLDEEPPLLQRAKYTLKDFQSDCECLRNREKELIKSDIMLTEPVERWVERTLAPVHDQQGTITDWLLIFHDITEQHKLEDLREDMTRMLVHDLRSPMAVLQSGLDLIELEVEDRNFDNLSELLALVRQGSNRLMRMINQLLDINKLESGKMPIHPDTLDVPTLFYETCARIAPLAIEAKIDIETKSDPHLPQLYVDHELMNRVLNNLLDNAIKFSPDGSKIELWARIDDTPQNNILIGIKDQGQGLSGKAQAKLFKKFQQVVSKRGRRVGSGLGLPFCKLVVEAHGGQIWAESTPGQGSTFIIRLPNKKHAPLKE